MDQQTTDVTIEDLALAYRKAKVDLFFSTTSRHIDIIEYEMSLHDNLTQLCEWINSEPDHLWIDEKFVGGIRIAPKSVKMDPHAKAQDSKEHRIFSAPDEEWDSMFEETQTPSATGTDTPSPMATFRLMSDCSIHMHVLSSLWISEVGSHLDKRLTASARGYRLRRTRQGEFNKMSQGNFAPYLHPYKKWRDDGFDAIEQALHENRKVYCLTADATEYFHSIDPSFLDRDTSFYELLADEYGESFNFSDRQIRIHDHFIKSLQVWQDTQADNLNGRGLQGQAAVRGLPVGLPASGVVANLALLEFDRIVRTQVRPLYYGRYVDDIILVWEDFSDTDSDEPLRNVDAAWDWLIQRFQAPDLEDHEAILTLVDGDRQEPESSYRFQPKYHGKSNICFSNEKNRLYSMHSNTGLGLLNTLRATAYQRSSEWRMMPELPRDETAVGSLVSRARNMDGDSADSLSGLAGITMNRSNFALTLRDFEAFGRDLQKDTWKPERFAFFQAVCDYVFTPSMVFEMDGYVERVFSLALNCEDFEEFHRLVKAFVSSSTKIQKVANFHVAGVETDSKAFGATGVTEIDFEKRLGVSIQTDWFLHIRERIFNAISKTVKELPQKIKDAIYELIGAYENKWQKNIQTSHTFDFNDVSWFFRILAPAAAEKSKSSNSFNEIFHRDLGTQPFRQRMLPADSLPVSFSVPSQGFSSNSNPLELFSDILRGQFDTYLDLLATTSLGKRERTQNSPQESDVGTDDVGRVYIQQIADDKVLHVDLESLWALVFPTRPFTTAELFEISNLFRVRGEKVESTATALRDALLVTRGYGIEQEALAGVRIDRNDQDRHRLKLSTTANLQFDIDNSTSLAKSPDHRIRRPGKSSVKQEHQNRVRIAVAMLETPASYLSKALHENPDLSAGRYRALTRVLNEAIRLSPKPDYLVLGELALPQKWYNAVAMKLAAAGISLISGVEYIHAGSNCKKQNKVHNQVWASLRHGTLGHLAYSVYKQDKQSAAHGERENLVREVNAQLQPEYGWCTPPIINHDDHAFGFLICSELTNINHRASFRGEVDTLFVPQWNKDLNTFTALVESAALDIHAHIVQVNNRIHGDTRIRMPAGDKHWLRDVVQLKGGMNDYVVLAELDLKSLRDFQSQYSSYSSEYKPLPDGYEIAATRK